MSYNAALSDMPSEPTRGAIEIKQSRATLLINHSRQQDKMTSATPEGALSGMERAGPHVALRSAPREAQCHYARDGVTTNRRSTDLRHDA